MDARRARGLVLLSWALVLSAPFARAQRDEVEAPPAAKASDKVELVIVGPDGKSLADAEVRFAVEDERGGAIPDETAPFGRRQAFYLEAPPFAGSVDSLLREQVPVRPSATGKVRLVWPQGRGLLVSARKDELWGFRWFARDWRETAGRGWNSDEPLRIELAPDWSLDVQVVDESGRPLERHGVRMRCGAPISSFEHIGYELRGATEPLVVWIDSLLVPPVERTLDPRRAPAGPVVLRMPANGSVLVHVLGPDGRPTPGPRWVELRVAAQREPAAGRRFDAADLRTRRSAAVHDGVARFDGVSLGLELEVLASGDEEEKPIRVRGPQGHGEVVEAFLDIAPRVPSEPRPPGWVIAAPPSASLHGFVLLDPGVPGEGIDVVVQSPAFGQPFSLTSSSIDREGKFSFGGLHVGSARIELRPKATQILPPEERPVFFRADVELVPGECTDPRLACIDLRGKAFAHRIALTGLDSQASFHARAYFRSAQLPLSRRLYDHPRQLPLVLVSPWPSIDVELFAPGYRSVVLRDLGARAEVELQPGIPVRLRLVTDGALPAPPRYLKAVLVPADEPEVGFDWEGPAFGATREVRTCAWKPGLMKVVWISAHHEPDRRSGGGYVREVQPAQTVFVLDSTQEQVFELPLSAEALASILNTDG